MGAGMIRFAVAVALIGATLFASLAGGSAPPGRYTFTAATVQDNPTGLMWQRVVPSGTYTQLKAVTYCGDLVLAGHADWRLPTRAELLSIVDRSRVDPAIDTTAFPGTPSVAFWTSSPYGGNSGAAWPVDFSNGATYGYNRTSLLSVRCVR